MSFKTILKIVGVLVLLGGIYAVYLFNKPHRDILGEKAELEISAADLIDKYIADENSANASYVDKVILVSGTISSIDSATVLFASGVSFSGDFKESTAQAGDAVNIKGRILAYDELLEELSLDNGVIVD